MHAVRYKYCIYFDYLDIGLWLFVCHSSLGVSIPCLYLIKIQRESQMCSYDNKPFSLVPSLWGSNSLLHIWCSKLITTPRAGFLRGPVSRIWQDVIGIIQSDKGLEATCANRKTPMKRWLSDSFIFNCKLVPYICLLSIKHWFRRLGIEAFYQINPTISIFVSRKKKKCDNRSLLFLSIEAGSICISLMGLHPVPVPWHGDENPALCCFKIYWFISANQTKEIL